MQTLPVSETQVWTNFTYMNVLHGLRKQQGGGRGRGEHGSEDIARHHQIQQDYIAYSAWTEDTRFISTRHTSPVGYQDCEVVVCYIDLGGGIRGALVNSRRFYPVVNMFLVWDRCLQLPGFKNRVKNSYPPQISEGGGGGEA